MCHTGITSSSLQFYHAACRISLYLTAFSFLLLLSYAIYHCLQSDYKPPLSTASLAFTSNAKHDLSGTDQWILSCLAHAVQECNTGFKEYLFPRATTACFNFWLYEFCDVYLASCIT
ncbi:unnamed protein product [Dibothriocephalus latus]|uniref:valine--tRNA ligase n=1 Tax=Dibothriocephalus latus TaxID=60516 RepID=A0A3P7PXH6_DIBLA|nr:unnamed protein product [Dibothriocephalus latus]